MNSGREGAVLEIMALAEQLSGFRVSEVESPAREGRSAGLPIPPETELEEVNRLGVVLVLA
jgi:hypothetical protein